MFLRSKRSPSGRLHWQVVETYRVKDYDRKIGDYRSMVRHRTIYSLGLHETRESAQAAWDAAVARGDDCESIQARRKGRDVTPADLAEERRRFAEMNGRA